MTARAKHLLWNSHQNMAKESAQIATDFERESGEQIARTSRRRIVRVAWQMLRAGRINAEQYRTRVERANAAGADAPYFGLRASR